MSIEAQPIYSERFPDEISPLSSEPAHTAYRYFWSHTHQSDSRPEAIREIEEELSLANKILGGFCGDGGKAVYPETYEAAVMSVLVDRSSDSPLDGGRSASRALKQYFIEYSRENDSAKVAYVAGLMSDRAKIRNFWTAQNAKAEVKDGNSEPNWDELCDLVDLDDMLDFAKNINIESILIMAAQISASLKKHMDVENSINDIFDKVKMSESLIAPLLEIMGYDGFAMNLNDMTKQIRLRNLGEIGQTALDLADKALTDYDEERVSSSVNEVIQNIFGEVDKEAVFDFNPETNILMEHGLCQASGDDQVNYMIVRRKTRGSLAWKAYQDRLKKLEKAGNESSIELVLPMDIIAAQIVFDEDKKGSSEETGSDVSNLTEIDKLASAFSNMIMNSIKNPLVTLKPSPSRDSAVHVRGTDMFRSKVGAAIYSGGYSGNLDPKPEQPGGMEVAKLTFQYNDDTERSPLNFEIQLLTERQRNAMRTEEIAHIFYKLGISDPTPEQIKCLKEINGRKDSVKQPAIIDPASAELYIRTILSTDSVDLGRAVFNPSK